MKRPVLTISMITAEAMRVLESNLTFTRRLSRRYDAPVGDRNLFAEWLRCPRGQWQDWLAERVSEYPHELQEPVRQEAEAYQRAWSREQEYADRSAAISRWRREQEAAELARRVKEAAEELKQQREAEKRGREREERIRRIEENSRIQLEAIRRRKEEQEERAIAQSRAWQMLEEDRAEWLSLVKENWPWEMQPDCNGESYELGMIEDEALV